MRRGSSGRLAATTTVAAVAKTEVTCRTVAAAATFADIVVVGRAHLQRRTAYCAPGRGSLLDRSLLRCRDIPQLGELQVVVVDPLRPVAVVVLQETLLEGDGDLGPVVGLTNLGTTHDGVGNPELRDQPTVLVLDLVNGRSTPRH